MIAPGKLAEMNTPHKITRHTQSDEHRQVEIIFISIKVYSTGTLKLIVHCVAVSTEKQDFQHGLIY